MPNRFARRIKSGEIRSPEELKAEFKALAKETHPDLGGSGADGGEFVRVREEYEAALRDFERHRFGFRAGGGASGTASVGGPRRGGGASGGGDGFPGGAAFRGAASGPLGEEELARLFATLELALRRGYPKRPRHEKERLRYEYARWRLAGALGRAEGGGEAAGEDYLGGFEAAFWAYEEAAPEAAARLRALLAELADYAGRRLPAMRTALVMELGALGRDPRAGRDLRDLPEALAAFLGIGPTLAAR